MLLFSILWYLQTLPCCAIPQHSKPALLPPLHLCTSTPPPNTMCWLHCCISTFCSIITSVLFTTILQQYISLHYRISTFGTSQSVNNGGRFSRCSWGTRRLRETWQAPEYNCFHPSYLILYHMSSNDIWCPQMSCNDIWHILSSLCISDDKFWHLTSADLFSPDICEPHIIWLHIDAASSWAASTRHPGSRALRGRESKNTSITTSTCTSKITNTSSCISTRTCTSTSKRMNTNKCTITCTSTCTRLEEHPKGHCTKYRV